MAICDTRHPDAYGSREETPQSADSKSWTTYIQVQRPTYRPAIRGVRTHRIQSVIFREPRTAYIHPYMLYEAAESFLSALMREYPRGMTFDDISLQEENPHTPSSTLNPSASSPRPCSAPCAHVPCPVPIDSPHQYRSIHHDPRTGASSSHAPESLAIAAGLSIPQSPELALHAWRLSLTLSHSCRTTTVFPP